MARVWTMEGEAAPELAAYDTLIETFMKTNSVSSFVLAVARQGRLVLSRAYGWREGQTHQKPLMLSTFRFASCSKLITTMCVHQLIERGQLALNTAVSTRITLPDLPDRKIVSTRWSTVTVQELLRMQSGLVSDYLNNDAAICKAFGHGMPVKSRAETVRYMLGAADNATANYRNFDFLVLSLLVEQVSGLPFETYIRQNIFAPLGLHRPQVAPSLPTQTKGAYELTYDAGGKSCSDNITGGADVPCPYGRYNNDIGLGVGGWLMTAPDFAKILSAFTVADCPLFTQDATSLQRMFGPPANGWALETRAATQSWEWGGDHPGVRPYTSRRADGVAIVSFFNTPSADAAWNPGLLNDLHATADGIATWPGANFDLFEETAIPTFAAGANWGAAPAKADPGSGWRGWFSLGGRFDDTPRAAMLSGNFHDVYGLGRGGRMWQKWYDRKEWRPTETGWSVHDEGYFLLGSSPSVLAIDDSRRDLYVRGADGVVYQQWWDGTWHGWRPRGGKIKGAPAAIAPTPATRDVYVRGLDDCLYQRWYVDGKWGPADNWFRHEDGGFRIGSEPSVIGGADWRDVYVRGQDGGVYHKHWSPQKGWSQWFGLGGKILGAPAAVSVKPGFIDLYAVGLDNRLWQKWWDGQQWNPSGTGWVLHDDGAQRLAGGVSVVSQHEGHRSVYARGIDGVAYTKFWLAS